jgi:predicted deacylase
LHDDHSPAATAQTNNAIGEDASSGEADDIAGKLQLAMNRTATAQIAEPESRSSLLLTLVRAPETRSPGKYLSLLGQVVPPGTITRLTWSPSDVFEGMSSETPVLVVNGEHAGPTVCLTAATHGDELNGIEMVRRIMHDLEAENLQGSVVGVPIVNLQGFRRGSRYLTDRRDLNRYFPGNPQGSSAARIAFSLFTQIVSHCDALIDLHTGSFHRTNLPQLRADLKHPAVVALAEGFGGMVVLHSEAAEGTLRAAATAAGIPAVTMEAGEPMRLQTREVRQGVAGIEHAISSLGLKRREGIFADPEPVYFRSSWVRSDHGGILFSVVRLGQVVDDGDILGTVTDPITNQQNLIYAPFNGRVLGMAVNQIVMPGFAAFRIGMATDAAAVVAQVDAGDENFE